MHRVTFIVSYKGSSMKEGYSMDGVCPATVVCLGV
jgi:hypothetical protein